MYFFFSQAKGTAEQNEKYCSKLESRVEGPFKRGEFSKGPGARSDLYDVISFAKEHGIKRAAEEHPEAYAKYYKGIERVVNLTKEHPLEAAPAAWRDWQEHLLGIVNGPADPRKILWFYDLNGNTGKSFMASYLVSHNDAIILRGSVGDMAYGYNDNPIVVFDLTRTQADPNFAKHLYSFAEELKRGVLYSSKYESGMKRFKVPHVIFFSNTTYPEGVWSDDRKFICDCANYRTTPGITFPPPRTIVELIDLS